jgi:acetoin utilization deacetylase AcuC-like enzyme
MGSERRASVTNLIITHANCALHGDVREAGEGDTPKGWKHPEQPARLAAVMEGLAATPTLEAIERTEAQRADTARLKTLHGSDYVDAMLQPVPVGVIDWYDEDTGRTAGSPEAALLSAGAAVKAAEVAMSESGADRVFVATRPPGHHAEQDKAMGFCFFGNIALAANRALELGAGKVAVLDFDVHHGNGTQALLWDNPDALFVSSQQMPLWPGTGEPSECGAHDNVLNIPLDPGCASAALLEAWKPALDRVDALEPGLILISAGFDAHADDPLAQLNVEEDGFHDLTAQIVALAQTHCAGRVVSVLEGGYDLPALTRSVTAHARALFEGV